MQRCSERMALNIAKMFRAPDIYNDINFYPTQEVGYEMGNVWQSFIKIDLKDKQNIRIPLFLIGCIHIRRVMYMPETKTILVPIKSYDKEVATTARTGDAIIKSFTFCLNSLVRIINKVNTNKGETYYGYPGIILNKDKRVLFMVVTNCKMEGEIDVTDYKVYIHPSVFYTEGLLEKCIANKIVPFILSHPIHLYTGKYIIPDHELCTTPEIVVKDITDEFFYNAVVPKDVPSKEEIDQLLLDHIDEVDNVVWYH